MVRGGGVEPPSVAYKATALRPIDEPRKLCLMLAYHLTGLGFSIPNLELTNRVSYVNVNNIWRL